MRYAIRTFWPAREDDRASSAARLAAFLGALAPLPYDFSVLYKGAWTRKPLPPPLLPDAEALASKLSQSYTSMHPRRVMTELGFNLNAWNGLRDETRFAHLSFRCGITSKRVSNAAILEVTTPDHLPREILRHLLTAAISAFQPAKGFVEVWVPTGLPDKLSYLRYQQDDGQILSALN